MKISDYIFQKGNIVSIYGEAGTGKTIIGVHVALELGNSLYISTKDSSYKARVEKLKGRPDVYFTQTPTLPEMISAILKASQLGLQLIVIDPVNYLYKLSRRKKDLELALILCQGFSKNGINNNNKVLLLWDISGNNRVAGELFMRRFSDEVLRITKGEIIGNLRVCKFRILDSGVVGCL